MLDNLKDPSSDFRDKSGRLSYLREETWGPCQWSAVWWDLQEIFIIRISRVSWVFKGLDRWERRWCKLYLAYPGWVLGVGNWSQGAAVQERHLEIRCNRKVFRSAFFLPKPPRLGAKERPGIAGGPKAKGLGSPARGALLISGSGVLG